MQTAGEQLGFLSFIFKSPLKVHPGDRHWSGGRAMGFRASWCGITSSFTPSWQCTCKVSELLGGRAGTGDSGTLSWELPQPRASHKCWVFLHYIWTFWPVCSQLGEIRCLCFTWRQHPSPDSEASGTVTSPWRPGVLMSYPLSLRVFKSCVLFSVTRFSCPCIFCYLFIFLRFYFK